MTKSGRSKLFYGLLMAFFVLGTSVIMYTNGWRLDISTLKLKKVGAIFIRSFPRETKIYLDNKAIRNNSGFFQNGTLIGNLFPKNYELKLVLDGYQNWKGDVRVSPSLVTEVKYAVLIPKNAIPVAAGQAQMGTVKNFWLWDNGQLIQDENDALLLGGGRVATGEVLGWTNDFQQLLTLNQETGVYFWNNIGNNTRVNVNLFLKNLGFGIKRKFKIIADPDDKRKLIVLEPRRISLLDMERSKLTVIYRTIGTEMNEKIASSQFFITWTEFDSKRDASILTIYDKFLQKTRLDKPSFPGKNVELKWLKGNRLALLQDNGSLYIYDFQSNNSAKIADDVKNFEFTDDGLTLATLENSALEVISSNPEIEYRKFNLPDMRTVIKVIWYFDKNHIFAVYPDRVAFLDINDATLGNFKTVATTRLAKYDEKNNQLYFISPNDDLERLDFPTK